MVDGQGLDHPLAVIERYESLKEPNSAAVGEKKLARANTSFQFDRSKQSLFRDRIVKIKDIRADIAVRRLRRDLNDAEVRNHGSQSEPCILRV